MTTLAAGCIQIALERYKELRKIEVWRDEAVKDIGFTLVVKEDGQELMVCVDCGKELWPRFIHAINHREKKLDHHGVKISECEQNRMARDGV